MHKQKADSKIFEQSHETAVSSLKRSPYSWNRRAQQLQRERERERESSHLHPQSAHAYHIWEDERAKIHIG